MKNSIHVKHINNLIQNLQEVRKLLDIHKKLTGSKPGNRSSVNVLNKSGVVLLVACWEAFIEDLAQTSFEKLLFQGENPDVFTNHVLTLASSELKTCKDERRVWELAGSGWKKVLKKHKNRTLEKYLGNFNTAKTRQIDELFEELIGLKSISKYWKWQGSNSKNNSIRLDSLIKMRGEIAHKVQTSRTVLKHYVNDSLDFIQNLAAITSNRTASHIYHRTGHKKYPWHTVSYNKHG